MPQSGRADGKGGAIGTGEDIERRLLVLIHDRLGVTAQIDDHLGSLGVDSLRLAELVSELERRFGFSADEEIFDVDTLADLAAYIRERSV